MDSGELEMERGITITSKVTRLDYRVRGSGSSEEDSDADAAADDDVVVVNVVDTPGHADFAGEVDRILSMVDGVVLVVDAAEGPKSQTKYVLGRALSLGLRPICVLNKADRADASTRIESGEVEMEILDLFEALGATDEQMDYVTLYASARGGWCVDDPDEALRISAKGGIAGGSSESRESSMRNLLDAVLTCIPAPSVHSYGGGGAREGDEENKGEEDMPLPPDTFADDPFSMAMTTVGYDRYLGRTCTGRICSGRISTGDSVTLLSRAVDDDDDDDDDDKGKGNTKAANSSPPQDNDKDRTSTVTGLFVNRGVSRTDLDPPAATAGDIVTLAGVPDTSKVGDTLTSRQNPVPSPISTPPLAPPTLSCVFGANDGPLVGKEGKIVTSSRIRSRLFDETDNNVTLTVIKSETDP